MCGNMLLCLREAGLLRDRPRSTQLLPLPRFAWHARPACCSSQLGSELLPPSVTHPPADLSDTPTKAAEAAPPAAAAGPAPESAAAAAAPANVMDLLSSLGGPGSPPAQQPAAPAAANPFGGPEVAAAEAPAQPARAPSGTVPLVAAVGAMASAKAASPRAPAAAAPPAAVAPAAATVAAAPTPAAAPALAAAVVSDDPFASDAFFAAAAGPAPIQPLGDVAAWFRKLCTATSGILYEDAFLQVGVTLGRGSVSHLAAAGCAPACWSSHPASHVSPPSLPRRHPPTPSPHQIGVKSQLSAGSVQLSLFLGNKGGEALQALVLAAPPTPAFALQLGPVPEVLDAKKQVGGWGEGWGAEERENRGWDEPKQSTCMCRPACLLIIIVLSPDSRPLCTRLRKLVVFAQVQVPLSATCLAPFTSPPLVQLGYRVPSTGQVRRAVVCDASMAAPTARDCTLCCQRGARWPLLDRVGGCGTYSAVRWLPFCMATGCCSPPFAPCQRALFTPASALASPSPPPQPHPTPPHPAGAVPQP